MLRGLKVLTPKREFASGFEPEPLSGQHWAGQNRQEPLQQQTWDEHLTQGLTEREEKALQAKEQE